MARMRLIFNVARDEYNDEDRGIVRIPHYPFRKYKIRHPVSPKNEDSLTVEQIRLLFGWQPIYNRETLAIDVIKIMFCLCGINSKDLYYLPKCNKLGRIEFNRAKTGRKYSIRAEPELLELIRKYQGVWYCFDFDQRYRDYENFQKAVNVGLKSICDRIHKKAKEENRKVDFPIGITTNWARHSWATIARNDCGLSKDDVALCLGHGQQTVTDVYIRKDYRIQDEANRKVLDKIFS